MAVLHVHLIGSVGPPSVIILGEGEIVIGRDEACDITIPDACPSRRHARILPDGDGYAVEDLGSRSGTRVGTLAGTVCIRGRTPLRHGDMIVFPPLAIEFRDTE